MTQHDDTHCMRLAIEASDKAVAAGNMPFGASLARDGVLLHVSQNNERTTSDCTGHAEVVLLREATAKLGRSALGGTTVYASGEPCAMCSGALFWAGVTRIVFAASNDDILAILGGPGIGMHCGEILATATSKVAVEGPLLRAEAIAVLKKLAAGSPEPRTTANRAESGQKAGRDGKLTDRRR
jgi:tRNA(adenine34) deaminase